LQSAEVAPEGVTVLTKVTSNLLRSNCRVTNQPDWGDVYIEIETDGTTAPDFASLAKYIVSHREVSHFHEEICEMMFTHLTEAYQPSRLMVACLYTRRGGLDINPIRATHRDMIPTMFTNVNYRNKKTLRQ
jgi:7-cyano-7-deazaguanine reductase